MEDLIKDVEYICLALTLVFAIIGFGFAILIAEVKTLHYKIKDIQDTLTDIASDTNNISNHVN